MKKIEQYINEHILKGHLKKQCQYVDLGLPSGTLWAKYNFGAKSENEHGLYVQWGQLIGEKEHTYDNNFISDKQYDKWLAKNYPNSYDKLKSNDDIITQTYGEKYSIPSRRDVDELFNNTTIEFDKIKQQVIIRSNNNSNYLIFPYTSLYACFSEKWLDDYDLYIPTTQKCSRDYFYCLCRDSIRDALIYKKIYCGNAVPIRAVKKR